VDRPRFEFPRKPATELRVDLLCDPTPPTKLDPADDMFTEHARRPVFALGEVQPCSDRLRADHRHTGEARSHHDRFAREHPNRGHQPTIWPCGLIEEGFEFVGVDLVVPAAADADGEAVDRRVGVQEASPSQKEERSHGSPIGQENQPSEEAAFAISRQMEMARRNTFLSGSSAPERCGSRKTWRSPLRQGRVQFPLRDTDLREHRLGGRHLECLLPLSA